MATNLSDSELFCPHCGKSTAANSAFCPFCGYDFVTKQARPTPPPASPYPGGQPGGYAPPQSYTPPSPPLYAGAPPVASRYAPQMPYYSFSNLVGVAVPVLVLLAIGMLLDLVAAGSGMNQAQLLASMQSGQVPSPGVIEANDAREAILAIAQVGVFLL